MQKPAGTTVRFYDPKTDTWQSVWVSPPQGVIQTFIGRKDGDEIVLEGRSRQGLPERWVFFDIRSDAYRWRAEETHDGGKTGVLTEEMDVRRLPEQP